VVILRVISAFLRVISTFL